MPKVLEDKLRREADARGFGKEHRNAFVYGTMREMGWKPKREARKALRNGRKESME